MVTCVRNEERLLPAHLAYHRAIGVERAYIFLDRCTDRTEDILQSIPWVCAITIDPEDAARFSYVGDLQRICMDRALEMARADGMDWLFMVDVDEFPVADNRRPLWQTEQSAIQRADLLPLLRRVSRSTEVVTFRVSELLPQDLEPDTPIWLQQTFLRQNYYRRSALDPCDGRIKSWIGNVGHSYGKCIVRTTADVQAFDPHFWTKNQGRFYPQQPGFFQLKEKKVGRLLHYVTIDYQQWRDKYEKLSHEPANWKTGASVSFPKQCWKQAAGRMSTTESREYYREWVASSAKQLDELVQKGTAIRNDIVQRVLTQAGAIGETDFSIPGPTGICRKQELLLSSSLWADTSEIGILRSQGAVRCHIADLHPNCLNGFRRTVYDRRGCYRWAGANAELRLAIEPGDYVMTIRSHPGKARRQKVHIKIDGRTVTNRFTYFVGLEATMTIRRGDFSDGDRHTFELSFGEVAADTGAAISELSFSPIRLAAAA